jgi:hypothetical protein
VLHTSTLDGFVIRQFRLNVIGNAEADAVFGIKARVINKAKLSPTFTSRMAGSLFPRKPENPARHDSGAAAQIGKLGQQLLCRDCNKFLESTKYQ